MNLKRFNDNFLKEKYIKGFTFAEYSYQKFI